MVAVFINGPVGSDDLCRHFCAFFLGLFTPVRVPFSDQASVAGLDFLHSGLFRQIQNCPRLFNFSIGICHRTLPAKNKNSMKKAVVRYCKPFPTQTPKESSRRPWGVIGALNRQIKSRLNNPDGISPIAEI